MEVSTLSRGVILPKLNLYPPRYKAAFAFSILLYPQSRPLILRLAFPHGVTTIHEGELRAYHVPRERQSRLGLACLPVARASASGDMVAPELGHLPFGPSLCLLEQATASLACLASRHLSAIHNVLTLPLDPSSRPL